MKDTLIDGIILINSQAKGLGLVLGWGDASREYPNFSLEEASTCYVTQGQDMGGSTP